MSRLSVSSVGSWALQRSRQYRLRIPPSNFQYPQSDRGRCNEEVAGCTSRNVCSFSILSRIVGAATWEMLGRITCTSGLSVSSVGSWALQQGVWGGGRPGVGGSFSILSRIVGAATDKGRPFYAVSIDFQYPQSDRGRCNSDLANRCGRAATLSVSSVGSWALQL